VQVEIESSHGIFLSTVKQFLTVNLVHLSFWSAVILWPASGVLAALTMSVAANVHGVISGAKQGAPHA
jgi:hypothetical protein